MSESKSETYEVGELVQVNTEGDAWADAEIVEATDTAVAVGCNGVGRLWYRRHHVRKHPSRLIASSAVESIAEISGATAVMQRAGMHLAKLSPGDVVYATACSHDGRRRTGMAVVGMVRTGAGCLIFERDPRLDIPALCAGDWLHVERAAPPPAWKVGDECEVQTHESLAWEAATVCRVDLTKAGPKVTVRLGSGIGYYIAGPSDIRRRLNAARLEPEMELLVPEQWSDDAPAEPLDAVIDGCTLRELLAMDANSRKEIGGRHRANFNASHRAAVSAYRLAELSARIAAGPSPGAERWREEQRRERGPRLTYCEED